MPCWRADIIIWNPCRSKVLRYSPDYDLAETIRTFSYTNWLKYIDKKKYFVCQSTKQTHVNLIRGRPLIWTKCLLSFLFGWLAIIIDTINISLRFETSIKLNLPIHIFSINQTSFYSKSMGAFRFQSLVSNAKQLIKLNSKHQRDVPKGYLAVYVGEVQRKRFVVPLSYLDQPLFQELLRRSEEDFGFNHPMGGLTIPCREEAFVHLTNQLHIS